MIWWTLAVSVSATAGASAGTGAASGAAIALAPPGDVSTGSGTAFDATVTAAGVAPGGGGGGRAERVRRAPIVIPQIETVTASAMTAAATGSAFDARINARDGDDDLVLSLALGDSYPLALAELVPA